MAGEWSKKIGEEGEKLMQIFFEKILGYQKVRTGLSLTCINGEKHKIGNSNKSSHGIDGLVSVVSPLEDKVIEIGIISMKFTSKIYPPNPSSKFKEHIIDLASTLECFKYSQLNSEINKEFSNVIRTDTIGILVWLSNESSLDCDVISQVSTTSVHNNYNFDKIIVLDNGRVSFFLNTIDSIRKEFGDDNIHFIYHNTGLNLNTIQSNGYGKYLPLIYLSSDIVPIVAQKTDGKKVFYIAVRDSFSYENLLMMLDFYKSFDHLDTINNVIISFPDYNNLKNQDDVDKAISKFDNSNISSILEVRKHSIDFKNM